MPDVLRVRSLSKRYDGPQPTIALDDVSFSVSLGTRVAIIGKSGAGKSTLLNILGLLDRPSSGEYLLRDNDVLSVNERERDRLRRNTMGFVFQSSHVLGQRTVAQNLDLKLSANRIDTLERGGLIESALSRVGLLDRRELLSRLLSGGERQRLAIARAMICTPDVILADEPTGNLDSENADTILALFDEYVGEGASVIVITHDQRVAAWADSGIVLESGRVKESF